MLKPILSKLDDIMLFQSHFFYSNVKLFANKFVDDDVTLRLRNSIS